MTNYSDVDDAITGRQSVRAFTQQPVQRDMLESILEVASRAPSGTNTQPWKVYVLQGHKRDALVQDVCAAIDAVHADPALAPQYQEAFAYYPKQWTQPYLDRRRENGWSLYGLLGITKGDKERMYAQMRRNFQFFDAPVGLIFTVDKVLERGSLLDYGMFLQNIMVAARARGLATCPQAAWSAYGSIVLPHIGAGEQEVLLCGMALGYADTSAIVNRLATPRVPASEFTTWLG